jgi:CubicO group peptidase (beta-lactamase class C family)
MIARDGAWNGQQIVPRQDRGDHRVQTKLPCTQSASLGYGYQYGLMFALIGIHGQAVFTDPGSKLIMVQTAARMKPIGDPGLAEAVALWYALVAQYGRR